MIKLKLAFFAIFLLNLPGNRGQISDKRLCADEKCTEIISVATTKIKYSSPDHRILSFAPNEEVTVYSKSAGSVKELWGVEIKGRRGYVNKEFIRESRIYKTNRSLTYVVDTELNVVDGKEVPLNSNEPRVENVEASGVDYEVIAGTTIRHGPNDAIQPTAVDESIRPTSSPSSELNKETLHLNVDNSQDHDIKSVSENIDSGAARIEEIESTANSEENNLDASTTDGLKDETLYDNVISSLNNWLKADDQEAGDDDDGDEDDDDEDFDNEDDEEDKSESKEQVEQSAETLKIEQLEPAAKVDESTVENEVKRDETHTRGLGDGNEENANSRDIVVENIDDFVRMRKLLSESSEDSAIEKASPEITTEHLKNERADDEIAKVADKIENNVTSEIDNIGSENDVVSENNSNDEISKLDVSLEPETQQAENNVPVQEEQRIESTQQEQRIESFQEEQPNENIQQEQPNENIQPPRENIQPPSESNPLDLQSTVDDTIKEEKQFEQSTNEITTTIPVDDVPPPHDLYDHVTPDPMEIQQDIDTNTTLDDHELPKIDITTNNEEIIADDKQTVEDLSENIRSDNEFTKNDNQEVNEEITQGTVDDKQVADENNDNENVQAGEEISANSEANKIDEETAEKQIDVETQSDAEDNNSNVFGGFSDWFGGRPQADKVEEIKPEEVEEIKPEDVEDRVNDLKAEDKHEHNFWDVVGTEDESGHTHGDDLLSKGLKDYENCPAGSIACVEDLPNVSAPNIEMNEVSDLDYSYLVSLVTFLGVTGISVVLFLFGYILIDKSRKEGPLIAKINNLEKALLIATKENHLLSNRILEVQTDSAIESDRVSDEAYEVLQLHFEEAVAAKGALEEQVQSLERELENSTEVGLELNRMLSDILSSQNASDTLIANVEQLQRQLVEQQSTINSLNVSLNLKDTENHELQLEMEINNKKVTDLQTELDKMVLNLLKIEEEKDTTQGKLEAELAAVKQRLDKTTQSFNIEKNNLMDEVKLLKTKHADVQRTLEVKINEYTLLKDSVNQVKAVKNNTETLQILLDVSSVKAEVQQLQRENETLNDLLLHEQQTKYAFEKQAELAIQEARLLKAKYDEADKEKLEAFTKLEVLSNYFKDRESQLQKELSKQESMWVEKHGEATSTVERIKYMQEELQNCKAQNESLKQEIVSQEVELKSQITVLEKKAHESWMLARQAERKLEDARQEAAQLRNRLTLKERNFAEEKAQNRLQSALEQNGEMPTSPLHMAVDSPASPPLLYGARDHLTTSPPMPGLPPFLPPPPGVPFMPPHMGGVPGFMPPPPSMFPVDHRPPPLGRMSSPPINSRYSPDSRYSPYDRNSPSPPYDDYGPSPPSMHRAYSPYNNRDDRRDYRRPLPPPKSRSNGKNEGAYSSGSANSNESLEKITRHHSKV